MLAGKGVETDALGQRNTLRHAFGVSLQKDTLHTHVQSQINWNTSAYRFCIPFASSKITLANSRTENRPSGESVTKSLCCYGDNDAYRHVITKPERKVA